MSRAGKWMGIAGAVLLWPGLAAALGLGELETRSALNQPFEARIPIVRAEAQELDTLSIELADAQTHERAMLTPPSVAGGLRFELMRGGAQPYIRVTTDQPIRDPFFTFLLEVNWSGGQMLREYTTLLDPPLLTQQAPTVTRAPTTRETAPPAAPAAPAPAPAPARSAPAREQDYGPVREGENLWEISRRVSRGTGASLNQVMLAIYRRNPQAFAGNVNLLRQGVVLDLPPADEIRTIPRQEAIRTIAAMNDAWRQRNAPAADTAQGAQEAGGESGGATAPATPATAEAETETAADAPRRPRLQLVAPDEALEGGMAADESQAGQAAGPAAASAGEQALRGELAQLEEELQESQALLRLRNAELAALQRRLSALDAGAAAAPESTVAESGSASAPAEPIEPAGSAAVAPPDPRPLAADGTEPGGVNLPGWLRNPLWLLLAAGGILLALLLLILRRRQAAAPDLTDEPAEFEDEDPAPAAAGDAAPEQAEDEPAGAATANAPTATDQVLTEIDLALAQAQTDEALDLVERALDESPSPAPVALRLKHAEVLAAAGLPAALDEALDRLEADPAARAHPDWPAVAALRAQAEPAGAAEAELGAVAGQETASVDRTALLDLDLDEAEPEADEAAAVQDEPLEFDQPVDGPGAGPAATGIPPDEQAEALESKLDLARAYLEMEAYEEARAALDVVAAQGSSLQRQEADTLRLQLPDAEVSAAPTPPADAMPASLDEAPSLPAAAPAAADDAEDVDESAADESSWLSEEESAVETKLDLARAYVGMEDLEGARGLLREVLEEGDDDQQAQAQRMLDELP